MKRWRVERAITDHGYGPGWVVLSHEGLELHWAPEWEQAFDFARALASLHLTASWRIA